MTYEPKHLKRWEMPSSYFGATWPNYYVFMHQNRDSEVLTRSNFICALEGIGGESDTVAIVRERHWAVGWIEWIAIHQDDEKTLKLADRIMEKLEDYPILDEFHYSDMEWDKVYDFWESMSVRQRAEYCREANISIFAARRSEFPNDPNGYLHELLIV